MVMLSAELDKELLRTELEKEVRETTIATLAARGIRRALSIEENSALVASVNKLLVGREAWLKQMREAERLKKRRALTLEEENALNDQVRALLRSHPNFIAHFKYESDNASDVDLSRATGFDAGFKGILSKITGALDDGPLGFFGKLLEKIFGLIFPIMFAFKEMGEKLNPKRTPADLVKEGLPDQADAELAMQEDELITKLSAIPNQTLEMTRLLETYKTDLENLKQVNCANGVIVPFEKTTEEYKRNTIMLRIKMFNEISAKVAPLLRTHEEAVAADQYQDFERQKQLKLNQQLTATNNDSPESKALLARIAGLVSNLDVLEKTAKDALDQEQTLMGSMPGVLNTNITNMYATHTANLNQEKARQESLARETLAREQAMRDEQELRRTRFAPNRQGNPVEEVD